MPDFRSCITEAAEAGEIDKDVAQLAHETYDDAFASASESLGPVDADRVAAKATMDRLEFEKIEAKRRRTLMIRTRRKVVEGIADLKKKRGYSDVQALGGGGARPPKGGWYQGGTPPKGGAGSGGAIAARALELLVENKPGLSGAPFASISGRYRAVRGQFDASMAAVIERFETKFGYDRPGRADLEHVVAELFGEDSGHAPSKMLAQAFAETGERARVMFNAAGGHIDKLDSWGLPQWHDPVKLRAIGKDAWVEAELPRLNRNKMIDRTTKAPLSDMRLKALLGDTWERVVTRGAIDRLPGNGTGLGPLANRRAEHRFMIYKDAASWMASQRDFGEGDPFQAMMGHLEDMARDIAQMQILGPNPDHQFQWLVNFAQREAQIEEGAGHVGAEDRAKSYVATAKDMMEHFVGTANIPINPKLASAGVSARAYTTGVALGSSIISDLPSNPFFGGMARLFTGLHLAGDFGELIRMVTSPERRAVARRSGFIIEQATDGFHRAMQDNLRLLTVGDRVNGNANAFARRLPAFIMRVQGQTGWDAARRRTFQFEFMAKLHDVREQTIADLWKGDAEDRTFASLLEARGFTEAEWARICSAPVWEPSPGSKFLKPGDIADQDLALRVSEMIDMQTRLAVPQTSLWTRAKLVGHERPGTSRGELNRSWAMFRSFTLNAFNMYAEEIFLRELKASGTDMVAYANMAKWAAASVGLLTLSGAVSMQLRETIKGNTPRDMSKPAFWAAATMQGGGLGPLGDFFYAAQSRNGKSAALQAQGPVAAAVSDAYNMTGGNVVEVTQAMTDPDHPADLMTAVNDKAHVGRDATNLLRRYTPLSSLWWARAAWNRAVVDQLQKLLDPDAEASFRSRARDMERTTGSQEWWAEGDMAPAFDGIGGGA